MIESINIVSFDVPFPANYGGVIDVFYKIKTFHSKGVKVHLHCFEYGRGEQPELEKYCESVTYYKRKISWINTMGKLPFIVKTRISNELKNNLLKNNYPILFEGLHTCYLLKDKDLKERIKIYRESNIEHEYYRHLANSERSFLKKIYLRKEANKLEEFEKIVKYATHTFLVSKTDYHYFESKYPNNSNHFIPSFHSGEEVKVEQGKGNFVLYQGNLSVSENYDAVMYLIRNVFSVLETPFVIAGLNPPDFLELEINKYPHISLIKNPSDTKMKELIKTAQINLLYTNQATGLKLKLLNVLYNGRFCIVNSKMVVGTTLDSICEVEDDISKTIVLIKELMVLEFPKSELEIRKKVLQENYSNAINFDRIGKVLNS